MNDPDLDPELPMGAIVRAEDVLTTGDRSRGLYVTRSDQSDRVFPDEKVARVDLDGYMARRWAIFTDEAHTPRAAEATLQDRLRRLDAPPHAAAQEEERDVRVLEVDWMTRRSASSPGGW